MCLAVPVRVVAIDEQGMASVELSGVTRSIALDLVPQTRVGDFVIVHVGFAIQRLDEKEAEVTLSLLDELASANKPAET